MSMQEYALPPFVPQDVYWRASDGRVYSGPLGQPISATEPGYVAWLASGHGPIPWPFELDGTSQTDAALQAVLTPHGMFATLAAYSADARYRRASGGFTITSLSPIPFLSDPTARNTLANASEYSKTQSVGYITQWKLSNGSFIPLNATQLETATQKMVSFVQSCFSCESSTLASITGGGITTRTQIDAAYAAIPNSVA